MKVLFFAQIREFTRRADCDLPVTNAIGADDLWTMLEKLFPGIANFRSSTRLARNADFATSGELFNNHDEVALLPPVSGG